MPFEAEREDTLSSDMPDNPELDASGAMVPAQPVGRAVCTPRNTFGLIRRYTIHSGPDPERTVTLHDLTDTPESPLAPELIPHSGLDSYYPYPNENAFLLGNWFWNTGARNSQESFKKLLKIVGDPRFRPEDVRSAPWAKINKALTLDHLDKPTAPHTAHTSSAPNHSNGSTDKLTSPHANQSSSAPEQLSGCTGWKKVPVKIKVPFHKQTAAHAAKDHVVADLYYRPIVSVIRERLASPHPHFHFQPYQLHWSAHPDLPEHRVYGEVYTSPAFLEVHEQLQTSPQEPNCNLERVVVPLMLWSDATNLTSVGSVKLWPTYLFFGNDSKYRRSKPSCQLCNHIAYFQSVSTSVLIR